MSFLVFAAVCLAAVPAPIVDETRPAAARIDPAELFPGELKKLEPHLGLAASGCVKVEPAGKGRNFHVRLELWENGKRSGKPLGGPGLALSSGVPFELSVSVREDPGRFDKPMYRVTTPGPGAGRSSQPRPASRCSTRRRRDRVPPRRWVGGRFAREGVRRGVG